MTPLESVKQSLDTYPPQLTKTPDALTEIAITTIGHSYQAFKAVEKGNFKQFRRLVEPYPGSLDYVFPGSRTSMVVKILFQKNLKFLKLACTLRPDLKPRFLDAFKTYLKLEINFSIQVFHKFQELHVITDVKEFALDLLRVKRQADWLEELTYSRVKPIHEIVWDLIEAQGKFTREELMASLEPKYYNKPNLIGVLGFSKEEYSRIKKENSSCVIS